MEIKRTFTHRTFGTIGEVTLLADAKLQLNGQELGRESVEYLLTFALQSLQDAYAGAKTADEAAGSFDKRLKRIMSGEMGTRGGAERITDRETEIAKIVISGAKMTFEKGVKTPDRYAAALARFAELPDAQRAAVEKKADRILALRAEEIDLALDI